MPATVTRVTVYLPSDAKEWNGRSTNGGVYGNPLYYVEQAARYAKDGETNVEFGNRPAEKIETRVQQETGAYTRLCEVFPEITFSRRVVKSTVGKVFKLDSETVQVMSDDWDTRYFVWTWDGEKLVKTHWHGVTGHHYEENPWRSVYEYAPGFGREDGADWFNSTYVTDQDLARGSKTFVVVSWEADCTEETKEAIQRWQDEQNRQARIQSNAAVFAKTVDQMYRNELRVRRDVDAVVTGGRKIKVGTRVRVVSTGEGQYGPWAKVLADGAKDAVFTDHKNLTVIPQWEWAFTDKLTAQFVLSSRVAALLREWAAGKLDWDIVCDAIGDESGNYAGEEFAAYLRQAPGMPEPAKDAEELDKVLNPRPPEPKVRKPRAKRQPKESAA